MTTTAVQETRGRVGRNDRGLVANAVDIRRFSTHDGTGIRTTIFLKGCTLACRWCQNPETISGRIHPVFFPSRCIDCGLCVQAAGDGEVRREEDGRIVVDTTRESDWRALAAVCPANAITFDGSRYTVEDLVTLALRDKPFFCDGGGVTISGGEPLFWPRFTRRLLERLHEEGVHTAIETALNVRREFLAACLPFLDLVYADCKLADPRRHREMTGTDNAQVLANLRYLLESEHRDAVVVRTPLIPGVTATDENIAAIARLICDIYPDVRYELLNYNPLAASKYQHVPGRTFLFPDGENPPMYTRERMDHYRGVARTSGVRHLITE